MSSALLHPLTTPAAWTSEALAGDPNWRMTLDDTARDELREVVKSAVASGKPATELSRADFVLPTLGAKLEGLRGQLEGGRGFQLLSGLPVQHFDDAANLVMLWGIGQYLGEPEPQDKAGNLLHVVTDTGQSVDGTDNVRGFQTNNELEFHTDGADIFALMCVRQSDTGGTSRLVSSTSVFNELVRRYPDLASVLQEPFHFDSRAQHPWEQKVQSVPIFIYHGGYMSALYKRRYIELAQRFDDVPRLSAAQLAALDWLDEIAAEPKLALSFKLAPGELLLANNYSCFHARTQYVDTDPARPRCMHRLWLTLPNGRPLPPIYAGTREWGLTYRRRHGAARAA
ncbi:MAG: taurine catabolism dioxygenase TauD [Gammaproteobacteria bacterium]|nr:taurine catabolism dioxygenase TauD [Gammaproteobacteria bacterium]